MINSSFILILSLLASQTISFPHPRAQPAPQAQTPCIPKFSIPGVSDTGASWQNIPLSNGAKYCDGSEGSSGTEKSATTGTGTGTGTGTTTTTSTAAVSSGSGGADAGTGDEEDPDCDDESGDGKSV